jgi:hypothetical protein
MIVKLLTGVATALVAASAHGRPISSAPRSRAAFPLRRGVTDV